MTVEHLQDRSAAVGGHSDLTRRVVSSLVLAPVVLGLVWVGGVAFVALVAVGAAIVALEWARIVGETRTGMLLAVDAGIVAAIALAGFARPVEALGLAAGTAIFAGLASGRWLMRGVVYAAGAALALVLLRNSAGDGRTAVLFLLAVVWAADIGGYVVGRTLGGPKLWPRVSPKKTWSGAAGGLLAALIAGPLVAYGLGIPLAPPLALVAVGLALASQIGDLYESQLKRAFGVKDSGALIPGHGGLLDRVDGLVFAGVAAFFLGAQRVGIGDPATGILLW